ncbi:hypothetical protein DD238_000434 [Peronospora effusa]|uniref:Ku C-terminal domain-containing protein n=1 Tax=Peronospora effusa TaxID=542832 RepID=A0A3M6VUF3_9STRA|nr:hypothetical protein DD238_000434 [Peronospora effusa]
METHIERFLSQNGSEFFPKALQCLSHFRKRSPEIQYSAQFNEFLTKLKNTRIAVMGRCEEDADSLRSAQVFVR